MLWNLYNSKHGMEIGRGHFSLHKTRKWSNTPRSYSWPHFFGTTHKGCDKKWSSAFKGSRQWGTTCLLCGSFGDSLASRCTGNVTLTSWKQLTKSHFENDFELPEPMKVYSHCNFPINMHDWGDQATLRRHTFMHTYMLTYSQTHKNACVSIEIYSFFMSAFID